MIYDYSDLTAGLRGVRLELATELDRIDTVLAMLEATSAKPTPTLVSEVMAKAEKATPKAAPKKPKAAGKKRTAAPVKCSKCEFECTPQNMWRHDRTHHQGDAPAPSAPAAPAVGRGKFQTLLACADCGETFAPDQMGRLNTHTIGVHGRRPTIDERRPVAA